MIHLNFDPTSLLPKYMQLRACIVDEIAKGHLTAGEKLPSVRELSKDLKISRTSIENAYNQLVAEGYVDSQPKKGYYVAYNTVGPKPHNLNDMGGFESRIPTEGSLFQAINTKADGAYDFKNEYVSKENFDYKLWKRHLNHVINYQVEDLYAYGTTRGELKLRQVLSEHFHRTRGIIAKPDQIVIGSGVTPLLSMLITLFDQMGIHTIGMENPGFGKAQGIFLGAGTGLVPIEVDFDGIHTERLYESHARACYVSPSHHFPTGYVMPVGDRQALLKWAREVNGYIIEDDFNFELRFEGRPIPAMQGLDRHERVIYLGSFSTVLAPAIRISFMVLPQDLNQLYDCHQKLFTQTASKLEQLALAHLIESGEFDRHIRKIRKQYSRKQDILLDLLKKILPSYVQISYSKAGLQILLKLPDRMTEDQVVKRCLEKGVIISGLSEYRFTQNDKGIPYLVLGYRGIETKAIHDGILKLKEALTESEKDLI